jgi:hypothetical protein
MKAKVQLLRMAALVFTVMTVSCGAPPASGPTQTICDDVSSEVGGCDPGRHEYLGATCDEVAKEWAAVLDEAVLGVIDGPDSVDDEGRSVRLRQAIVITTIDADQHLESLDLAAGCNAEAFLATAEPLLSADLRTKVGGAMYDGDPLVPYEEWLADVRKVVAVIEADQ